MGVKHGKDAKIEKNDVAIAYANEWTIEFNQDEHDITDFGDDWQAVHGGIARATGTFTCFFDQSNTEQKAIHDALVTAAPTGALTDLEFYLDSTNYYSGNVLIGTIAIAVPVNDIIKIVFNWSSNGVISYN